MAQQPPIYTNIVIHNSADVIMARRRGRSLADDMGFTATAGEEIALVVSELGTNLLKHAHSGTLNLGTCPGDNGRTAILIETLSQGPPFPPESIALQDGISTHGGLGYGLGTVNRLMDELHISSDGPTRITTRRWLPDERPAHRTPSPEVGVATRAHPGCDCNGDAAILVGDPKATLLGVMDGLGHGPHAHRAAAKARDYIEHHATLPLADIFLGVHRTCLGTRGVVMALARIDAVPKRLTLAGIGNIEVRFRSLLDTVQPTFRRGIVGQKMPTALILEFPWTAESLLVMHSDGVGSNWSIDDLYARRDTPAHMLAQRMLGSLARDHDDATVLVARSPATSTGDGP